MNHSSFFLDVFPLPITKMNGLQRVLQTIHSLFFGATDKPCGEGVQTLT